MTCVVGLVHSDRIILGADSAAVAGDALSLRAEPKIFKIGQADGPPAAIGFAGDFRMRDLLGSFKLPEHKEVTFDRAVNRSFLIDKMIPAVQRLFKRGNFKAEGEELGGPFILVYRNWIYEVAIDYSVSSIPDPYFAIGMGGPSAFAVLHYIHQNLDPKSIHPEKMVRDALTVSEQMCTGVRGPMKILELPFTALK